jgi:hypothetical protein
VNCYNCGAATEPAQKFCEGCGAKVTAEPAGAHRLAEDQPSGSGGGSLSASQINASQINGGQINSGQWPARQPAPVSQPPARPPIPGPGPGMTLPGSPIRLGDGEQVLRQYRAVQLRSKKRGEGTLYVTDARIVFFARAQGRGTQRASSLVQQTRLEDVSGLEAFVSRRTNVLLLVFTAVMGVAALASLATGAFLPFIVFFLIAGLAAVAIFSGAAERGRAGVRIHAKMAHGSMGFGTFQNQRSGLETLLSLFIFPVLLFLRAQTAFDVLLGRPGDDSDQLIAELGALILDLQTRGELAAAYWGGPVAVPAARAGTATGTTPSHALS